MHLKSITKGPINCVDAMCDLSTCHAECCRGKTLSFTAPLLANLPSPRGSIQIALNSCLVIEFWQKFQDLGENLKNVNFQRKRKFLLVLQLSLQKMPHILDRFCRPLFANLPLLQRRPQVALNSCLVIEFWRKCLNISKNPTKLYIYNAKRKFLLELN